MPPSYLRYKKGPSFNLPPSSPLFVATPLVKHWICTQELANGRKSVEAYS